MKSAAEKFQDLWDAIADDGAESHQRRSKLMAAYGFPRGDSEIDHSPDSAKQERDFAMACLRGIGGQEGDFLFESPNLISVLATEIGLLPPPEGNDSPVRPWFGGDWVSMAELIIYIANLQLHGQRRDSFGRNPQELIRVYEVEWLTDSLSTANILKAKVKLGSGGTPHPISLQHKEDATDSEWISLAAPIEKLYLISSQLPDGKNSGIPANLWDFLPAGTEPGEES